MFLNKKLTETTKLILRLAEEHKNNPKGFIDRIENLPENSGIPKNENGILFL